MKIKDMILTEFIYSTCMHSTLDLTLAAWAHYYIQMGGV